MITQTTLNLTMYPCINTHLIYSSISSLWLESDIRFARCKADTFFVCSAQAFLACE